ncbi:precorrin-6y C5,15-methyltransferase (decarboxylating) subunit CbiE [Defluviimonas sp. WL0002]|uniref:Precorrin-6y C5,15-methyltransferase (Decarboxylating) subunit CbiE n=1 Tax=Albidovulum marisflavi TaxID=2984159 RepID=A0ABT2Z9C7_9RHOB|nr:precorrin-6y C5,15-methyltransferase (decarboxylating) subunit CbiE [Defluviimonas sp. WL0002]MCV2867744.1 precorrin-6y C5,15-methyltransferase (decarboxylating) subunit CbiE [Defluviimonas sp. WL0002]
MSDPWLTIIGLGEDGLAGLSEASRAALATADSIFGGPRHLALAGAGKRGREWPVPFSVAPVLAERGRRVVVLASGDPFWHGAGGSLSSHLTDGEWVCHPAPSTFSLAASRLGWRLEETLCLGLHAAPFERLVPILGRGVRAICLLRDGDAVPALADWLTARGFGASALMVLESLGGPAEKIRRTAAQHCTVRDAAYPVAVAIEADGAAGLPHASGLPDDLFISDGVMTKRPIRALTLSALAPRPGEVLWDLGAGSGSIAVEWCLAAPGARASAVESRTDRAANVRANAAAFGLSHRVTVTEAAWPDALNELPCPDAVFIGGGATAAAIDAVWAAVPAGTRLVVNAVTIETEALLAACHAEKGGSLLRIELAASEPLGRMRGWMPARPVVQWSVTT